MTEQEKLLLNMLIETINERYQESLSGQESNLSKQDNVDYFFGLAAGFYDSLYTIEGILRKANCNLNDFADKITPDLKLLVPKNDKLF